jgi:hypothetical protein
VNGRMQAFQPLNGLYLQSAARMSTCVYFTLYLNFSLYIHLKSLINNEISVARRIEAVWTGGKIIVNSIKVCLTSPIPSSRMFFALSLGPVAQLGARLNRTEEVRGSNPLRSTTDLRIKIGDFRLRCKS